MKRSWYIVGIVLVAAVALAGPPLAQAQRRPGRMAGPAMRRAAAAQRRAQVRAERAPVPRNWMERLQKMSPQEQERFLENNKRFQQLPPWRQAQIRARLKQWNQLTPEQKQNLARRAQILQRLSPAERRELRQVILPRWKQLPPDRRAVLVRKLLQLQPLNDAERAKRLKNPDFVRGLSPEERNLLEQLSKLKVGPGGENP